MINSHKCVHISQSALFLLATLLVVSSGVAGGGDAAVYDLAACVNRAMEVNPGVLAADTDVRVAQSQLDQVKAARFLPDFKLKWYLGPSPEARGDGISGDSDWGNLSLFSRTEVTLVQPLFTFGRLGAAEDAAGGGVEVRRWGSRKARLDLEKRVVEAYYGILLTDHLWELAQEAREEIGRARAVVEEKLEEEEGDYTYVDLARIDRFAYDVEENGNRAEKERALARSAMRLLLDLTPSDSIGLEDGRLDPVGVDVLPLETYADRVDDRPELVQLRAASRARSAQARLAQAEFYPNVFLGGQFKHGYAPNRDNQSNPFLKDDFNFTQIGAVLGLQQSLSFGMTSARKRKAQLEVEKIAYQERLARGVSQLEIERIYRSLKEARANVAAARRAVRATRRWFISARDGFNAGLEEASELLDAVKEYSIIRAKYYAQVYTFNKTWASMQRATGRSILE